MPLAEPTRAVKNIIFACAHDAGRSQMAAALFNRQADRTHVRAMSAGMGPARLIYPTVVEAMAEIGVDLRGVAPRRMTHMLAYEAELVVTMGCRRECAMVPGRRSEDWQVPSLSAEPIDRVRQIRDELDQQVRALIVREGWAP